MQPHAERRRRLLERLDGVALVPSHPVTIRNNDVEHEYRQDSDLYYLTGFEEPRALLLLSTVHPEHRAVLFLRDRDAEVEQWDGPRLGVAAACERLGVDAAFPLGELDKRLPDYLKGAAELCYELGRIPTLDVRVLRAIRKARGKGRAKEGWPTRIVHPELSLHELRLRKSDEELERMRRAANITAEAHLRAMAFAAPGRYEYEVESVLCDVFRRSGAKRNAYAPIVGSGANATVLHYHANDRQLCDGELLLVDAGCEYRHYAADVTRTFPVNGTFTEPQRQIYEAVLHAQLAAIEAVRPGTTLPEVHAVSLRGIVDGLLALGLLEGNADEVIEKETFKRFFMHRTSHWLGMDVHDVGAYFVGGQAQKLEPGMVLTVEPGIYISATDETVPERYRGIGVRIEDDVLVTAGGRENLSAATPKTVDDVERACRG